MTDSTVAGECAETAVIDVGPVCDVLVRRDMMGNKPTEKYDEKGCHMAATEKGVLVRILVLNALVVGGRGKMSTSPSDDSDKVSVIPASVNGVVVMG